PGRPGARLRAVQRLPRRRRPARRRRPDLHRGERRERLLRPDHLRREGRGGGGIRGGCAGLRRRGHSGAGRRHPLPPLRQLPADPARGQSGAARRDIRPFGRRSCRPARRPAARGVRRRGAPRPGHPVSAPSEPAGLTMLDLIERTKRARPLDRAAMRYLARGVADGSVPDYQLAAWLMAARLNGLTAPETLALTREMVATGETLDWTELGVPVVDKHSTG